MRLKRANRGSKPRNGRKTFGPKENALGPLESLFTINKEKKSVIGVCYPVSQRAAPSVLSGLQLATSELSQPAHGGARAAQTAGKATRLGMAACRMIRE